MNISYNWLKDLIDIDMSAGEVAAALTRVGLAVEGVHAHGEDFVLDIDLTSNRPDCLSHLGVARELSVTTQAKVESPKSQVGTQKPKTENQALVTIQDADLCHRFVGRVIRNVKIGPSPQWLVDRLEAIGERAINNVADITNYVMHELGQPMHAFDFDKLTDSRIVVRRAKNAETITTLDEAERKLDDTMLAICDAEKPVAVAGVMGGLASSITDSTTSVFLEVAYFDRANIRATSRKLNLATEASYRFERGVDIENLLRASNRATELICDLAGGEALDLVDVYPTRFTPNAVESKDISAAVKRLTGLSVTGDECDRILNALGITNGDKPTIYVSPTWRHDIAIEEDLVEEVARHAGYENIANELPPAFGAGEYQHHESRERRLRETLVDMGFDEAISYSFIDTRHDGVFEPIQGLIDKGSEEPLVTLRDSVIEGAVRMRPTILPGLLDAVRLNLNHQRRDLKLFEIGKVFATNPDESGLPNEQEFLSLVITGGDISQNKKLANRELDFFDAKGAIEAALEAAGLGCVEFTTADVKHLRRGQSAAISSGGIAIGNVGRLADTIAADYKFKQPVYVAELNLQAGFSTPRQQAVYAPLVRYPAISRDVTFTAKRDVTFDSIRRSAIDQKHELCRNVDFVDIYEGKGLAGDERAITIRLEYRSDERTLIEDEVEALHQQILAKIQQDLPVSLRT
ncbi:MAG: phenylalanine--tRNA ligase subunit beta [Pyrinomonadaceae bacterium]